MRLHVIFGCKGRQIEPISLLTPKQIDDRAGVKLCDNQLADYESTKEIAIDIDDEVLYELYRTKSNAAILAPRLDVPKLVEPHFVDQLIQQVDERLANAVQNTQTGRFVQRIKFVREIAGLGLKESKNFVEAHWADPRA